MNKQTTQPGLIPFSLRQAIALASLTGLAVLTGCSSGSDSTGLSDRDDSGSEAPFSTAIIDASSSDSYTYYNLDTAEVVPLTDAEAASSDAWHIAFRRLAVKLNGGSSGAGNVEGALAVAQDDFYDGSDNPDANVFLNATADSEEEHLLAAVDTGALSFSADANSSAIAIPGSMLSPTELDMGWYIYDMTTHSISVNDANGWLLRSESGDSFARFHATALTYTSGASLDVTFAFDVQDEGDSAFTRSTTFNASVPTSGGSDCFDFATDSSVDCATSDAWDLKLEVSGRDWTLWTNSGVSGDGNGGALGDPYAWSDLSDNSQFNNATAPTALGGSDITAFYSTDTSSGVFEENTWYAYNLSGQHKIWPNYRVFVIDTDATDADSAKYKLQLTNYYSEGGTSGHPNIRFMALED